MKKTFLLCLFFTFCIRQVHGQDTELIIRSPGSSDIEAEKPKGFFQKIGHLINDVDTNYISPNQYKFAFMLENSNWYEYYHFSNNDDIPQTLKFSPRMNYKLGGYFGWKWIFIGYSIDLRNLFNKNKNQSRRKEFGLSLYSSIVGCDLYYRKSGNAFKLRNIEDFLPEDYTGDINKNIDGFSVDIKGADIYWIFNHKRFSYPAAYSQSTNQRKSTGSVIAGLSYSEHNVNFDKYSLPNPVFEQLSDDLDFQKIEYKDFSVSIGYSYNWVFTKNCLANLSLTPAIAYKHSKINSERTNYPVMNNLNFDLITRAGVTYNNSKYFVGASLVMHTYGYRSDNFNMNNSFGTLRIYAGFNFLKKKKVSQLPVIDAVFLYLKAN